MAVPTAVAPIFRYLSSSICSLILLMSLTITAAYASKDAVQEATNSHDFDRQGEVGESWTKLTSVPDWTRYQ